MWLILPLMLACVAMLLIWAHGTWVWVVLGASALVWLQGVGSLSLRISRERRREEER